VSQEIGSSSLSKRLQSFDVWRISNGCQVLCGQFKQQGLGLGNVRRTPRERLSEIGKGLHQMGQNFLSDLVARKGLVGVAGVFNPRQTIFSRLGTQLIGWDPQNRSVISHRVVGPLRSHAGQARQTRATGQGQNHGLYLIICVLCESNVFDVPPPLGEQHVLQGLVPGAPSCVLWTLSRSMLGIDMHHFDWNVVQITKPFTVLYKIIRHTLQTMVDMNSMNLSRPLQLASP
jgi:hypothetical protein